MQQAGIQNVDQLTQDQRFVIEVMWLAGFEATKIADQANTSAYYVRQLTADLGITNRYHWTTAKRQQEIDKLQMMAPAGLQIEPEWLKARDLVADLKNVDGDVVSLLRKHDQIFSKVPEVQARWEAERQQEVKNEKARLRDKKQRRGMDIQNIKVQVDEGQLPDGRTVRIDRVQGWLLSLHKKQPATWTKPMIQAGGRFSVDYEQSENYGLGGSSYDVGVDCSPTERVHYGVVARKRVRDLESYLGQDEDGQERYRILELCIGLNFTMSDLAAKGLGQAGDLRERLRKALNKTAVFYDEQKAEPLSMFLERSEKLINKFKNRA